MTATATRAYRLLTTFREQLDLDLTGATIATEAGTGPFLFSPLAAALASAARVIAVCPDSSYASHCKLTNDLRMHATAWNVPHETIVAIPRRDLVPAGIDVFLNLGFLRPLDKLMLQKASERAVVSYMSESWEFRPGDLDLRECHRRGILVAGVNENFRDFAVFDACGHLALKLLFEAGIEVSGCRIAVLSADRFGDVITNSLRINNAQPILLNDAASLTRNVIVAIDAIIVATYSGEADVMRRCPLKPSEIAALNPDLKIVQLAGAINFSGYSDAGIVCYPPEQLTPYRMSRTLAYLGVRPTLALISLGLKVGELLLKYRQIGRLSSEYEGLVQMFDPS